MEEFYPFLDSTGLAVTDYVGFRSFGYLKGVSATWPVEIINIKSFCDSFWYQIRRIEKSAAMNASDTHCSIVGGEYGFFNDVSSYKGMYVLILGQKEKPVKGLI
ncbi:hypothetical protein [Sporolactobacillus vineae]|uniref:hypothetical protein n=1 Tax=Sporolactobacillus vineae TaxID=444463 RepID=UPI000287EFBB|nr:hypothetical protein [Sporolactobacillus vineae]